MTIQHLPDGTCIVIPPPLCSPGYTIQTTNGQCVCVPPPACLSDVSLNIEVSYLDAAPISIESSYANNTYTTTVMGEVGATIDVSIDGGITFTSQNVDTYGFCQYTSQSFVEILKYTSPLGEVMLKQLVYDPFGGGVTITNIRTCSQTKRAELIVTGANVLEFQWLADGIEVLQIIGNSIWFKGCGTISVKNIYLDCTDLSLEVPIIIIGICGIPEVKVTPIDQVTYMVMVVPNGILAQPPTWDFGTATPAPPPLSTPPLAYLIDWDSANGDTEINVTVHNECGEYNLDIPFQKCNPFATIEACTPTIYKWSPKGESLNSIEIFGVTYTPPTPMPLQPANAAAITTWLNETVAPIVGGIWHVEIIQLIDNLKVVRFFWSICQQLSVGDVTINTDAESLQAFLQQVVPNLTLLSLTTYDTAPVDVENFTWTLEDGVSLVYGTLNSHTIMVDGSGEVCLSFNVAGCDVETTICQTITSQATCSEVQHAYAVNWLHTETEVLESNGVYTITYLFNKVRVMYKGTGSLDGLNVTIDWGDGIVETLPYLDDGLSIVSGMDIQHIYVSPGDVHKCTITFTDSQGLDFQEICYFAYESPWNRNKNSLPSAKELIGSNRVIFTDFTANCSQIYAKFGTGHGHHVPFEDDMRIEEFVTIQSGIYVLPLVLPLQDSINEITHQTESPGTYSVKGVCTWLDTNNNNASEVRYTASVIFNTNII